MGTLAPRVGEVVEPQPFLGIEEILQRGLDRILLAGQPGRPGRHHLLERVALRPGFERCVVDGLEDVVVGSADPHAEVVEHFLPSAGLSGDAVYRVLELLQGFRSPHHGEKVRKLGDSPAVLELQVSLPLGVFGRDLLRLGEIQAPAKVLGTFPAVHLVGPELVEEIGGAVVGRLREHVGLDGRGFRCNIRIVRYPYGFTDG